ncbi:hypothetical protein P4B35_13050 [Pontiellaceae bacterium B12227]|nr:hypothetical protein [Pontiellaceae bacterium B12227]
MMTRFFLLTIFSLFFMQTALGEEQDAGGSTNRLSVQNFELSDQYKKKLPQSFPKDKVSIFALADRKGSDQLENWITPFYKRYQARVDICGVANMKGLPKMMRPMLRSIFRKSIEYPVMMDWTGAVCESLTYQKGVADIFVVNRNGLVVHRINGEANEEKLQACYAVIDRLIEEKDAGAAGEANAKLQSKGRQLLESTSDAPLRES